jgi:uncharacterized protein (DUF1800 family)
VVTKQLKNQHLLWRAAFGVSVSEIRGVPAFNPHKLYAEIEKPSLEKPAYINVASNNLKEVFKNAATPAAMQQTYKNLSKEQRKTIRIQNVQDIKSLNVTWLNEMIGSDAQLREKMSFFWHGHFACRIQNIYYQQLLLDIVRNNALGNFGDLLKGVSKSASMLQFLNNQQNLKQHANENFAREVMELFTLGRGNYTETDVKEAARAFTGWGFNLDGEFVFRQFAHDAGEKTFLGKTGNFNGDDILNILLEQKQTAIFITRKIYKYFVNENVDDAKVQILAARFYQNNYDIRKLMEDIFTGDSFFDDVNIGTHIKSPVELLVGIRRILPMQLENDYIQLLFQRALGQLLFYPPNVAGWPGGKSWIDSSSLMLRMRIPQLIKDDETFFLNAKTDDDQAMGMKENLVQKNKDMADNPNKIAKDGFRVLAKVDWDTYTKQFTNVPRENLYNTLQATVLQTPQNSVQEKTVMEISSAQTKDDYIKTVTVALMSTPEYQLC